MLLDEFRAEMGVERVGVGPAEHLVLEQRVVDVVEELAEPGQQVRLGDEQIDGKPHVHGALDQIQLLGQLAGLLRNPVGGILDQTLDGQHQKQAVDGALRTGFFEQAEELTPLRRLTGLCRAEDHRTGGVEDDGAVGEPPVHVHRAARSLEFILKAGWKFNTGMADGLGLPGAGLADDHVPRELVDVLAPAPEFLHAGLKFLPQLVQRRALIGVADGFRRGRGLGLDGRRKHPALPPGAHPAPEIVTTKEQQKEDDDGHGHPDAKLFGQGDHRRDGTQTHGSQAPFYQPAKF